jgi:hypothetical protein
MSKRDRLSARQREISAARTEVDEVQERDRMRNRKKSAANNALVTEAPRECAVRSGRVYRTRDQGKVCVSFRSAPAALLIAQKRKKSAENISKVVPPGPWRDGAAGERGWCKVVRRTMSNALQAGEGPRRRTLASPAYFGLAGVL